MMISGPHKGMNMLIGFCSSQMCNPVPDKIKKSKAEDYVKLVAKIKIEIREKSPFFCPDCGHALFYERLIKDKVKK